MTASSRSQSNGAVDSKCQIMSDQHALTDTENVVRTSKWVAVHYSGVSAELIFGKSHRDGNDLAFCRKARITHERSLRAQPAHASEAKIIATLFNLQPASAG